MGTWTGITEQHIDEGEVGEGGGGSAGSGAASAVQHPEPGEGYHFEVYRDDAAGDNDPWRVALEGTLDDVNFGENPPLDGRRLEAAQKYCEIPVRGPIFGVRIKIQNDDPTPTDEVAATVKFRRDGVSI